MSNIPFKSGRMGFIYIVTFLFKRLADGFVCRACGITIFLLKQASPHYDADNWQEESCNQLLNSPGPCNTNRTKDFLLINKGFSLSLRLPANQRMSCRVSFLLLLLLRFPN
jgi:hypothetical protein